MGFIKKRFKNIKPPQFKDGLKVQILLAMFVFFIVMRVTYTLEIYDYKYDYKVGDSVTEDIILPEDYNDLEATMLLKDNVRYDVDEIYTIDPSVYVKAKEEIESFYMKAYDTRAEYADDEVLRDRVITYVLRNQMTLTQEELIYLSHMDDYDLRLSENYVYDGLKEILSKGVTNDNIIQNKGAVDAYVGAIDQLPQDVLPIVSKIIKHNVLVNSSVDETATAELFQVKIDEIDDVVLNKGSVLVAKGHTLDERAYTILNDLDLNNLHHWKQKLPLYSMDILVLVILYVMYKVIYTYYKKKTALVAGKHIYLNFAIIISVYLLTYALKGFSAYLLLLPTVAMLISILNEARLGIVYAIFVAILVGVIFNLPIEVVAFSLMASMLAALLVDNVYQRGRIFLSGIIISCVYSIMIVAIAIAKGTGLSMTLEHVLFGVASGILCSVITIGSLPLWEITFKILTPLKLLEYANPNHPLMKKMLLEAPGTYHHSILVANLAEAAAHDIGGNAFLTRVGAYFHDIGKIEKPYLYVENQYDGHNPHDQFIPMTSAKIIKDHVTNGIELGKKYHLPKEIIAFIGQHHGTTRIQYFYHKALKYEDESVIDKSIYTYNGPPPTSKEIAIVMLADSVEAGVRSLKAPDQAGIESLIHKIIQGKIEAKQLNGSGLTLHDLDVIEGSFTTNLSSAFHERIEYPNEKKDTHINRVK